MNDDVAIGQRIKQFREALELSQEDLARGVSAFGVQFHQATVWKVESGSRRVQAAELKPLASVLGVSIDALLGESPAEPSRGIDELLQLLTTAKLSELERIRDAATTAIAIRSQQGGAS